MFHFSNRPHHTGKKSMSRAKVYGLLMALAMLFTAGLCACSAQPHAAAETAPQTIVALWAMGRIGGLAVSPDGKKIAYTVAYYSVPENKSNREVFVMNADGSDNRQITRTPYQENEVTWIKGGTKLAFLS